MKIDFRSFVFENNMLVLSKTASFEARNFFAEYVGVPFSDYEPSGFVCHKDFQMQRFSIRGSNYTQGLTFIHTKGRLLVCLHSDYMVLLEKIAQSDYKKRRKFFIKDMTNFWLKYDRFEISTKDRSVKKKRFLPEKESPKIESIEKRHLL